MFCGAGEGSPVLSSNEVGFWSVVLEVVIGVVVLGFGSVSIADLGSSSDLDGVGVGSGSTVVLGSWVL